MKSYDANISQNIEDLNTEIESLYSCFIELIKNPNTINYDKVLSCLDYMKQEAEELITEYVDSGY